MFTALIIIFMTGILLVAIEDKIGVDKSAITLLMASASWIVVVFFGVSQDIPTVFVEYLGETSETLFFILGALTLIEVVDSNGGFKIITRSITTINKRKLLWIVSFIVFMLAALLDDIAAAVIIIAMLRKMIPDTNIRIIYSCMVIIAANAGGAFSPIGDVTTMILWMGGNVGSLHQIGALFLPSMVCMLVPLVITTLRFKKGEEIGRSIEAAIDMKIINTELGRNSRLFLFLIAMITMISVPFFQETTHLPPYLGIMTGLGIVWVYADLVYKRKKTDPLLKHSVAQALKKIDVSTILFFLGIFMTVSAMEESGLLKAVGAKLETLAINPMTLSFTIGLVSSFTDNVALVSAAQAMYPIAETGEYMINSHFWTFLAYCAVTGGSLLLVGSATGITVMGIEKIGFGYYFKRFSLLALLGYLAGAGTYIILA